MIEDILIAFIVVSLILTELAGVFLRRYGFITISEVARQSRPQRIAVSALFIVGLVWWRVHA